MSNLKIAQPVRVKTDKSTPRGPHGDTIAALVTFVNDDGTVNLAAFDRVGVPFSMIGVAPDRIETDEPDDAPADPAPEPEPTKSRKKT